MGNSDGQGIGQVPKSLCAPPRLFRSLNTNGLLFQREIPKSNPPLLCTPRRPLDRFQDVATVALTPRKGLP